jgi:uncharacterized membrane protein YdjX (TVP38/TMEM64 family)
LTLLGLGLLGGVALGLALGPSRGDVQGAVDHAGAYGPLTYVALYATLTVLLVPGTIPTLVGGALFGTIGWHCLDDRWHDHRGGGLVLDRAAPGARTGRADRGERALRVDEWLRRRRFLAVLHARLIPVVPFNPLNHAAGATSISARDYTLATIIGIVPGTVAYTALGSSLRNPGSGRFLIPLGAIVVLTAALTVRERSRARRGRLRPDGRGKR